MKSGRRAAYASVMRILPQLLEVGTVRLAMHGMVVRVPDRAAVWADGLITAAAPGIKRITTNR